MGVSDVRDRLAAVRDRVRRACALAGRAPESVTLLLASKAQPLEAVRAALEADAGQRAADPTLAPVLLAGALVLAGCSASPAAQRYQALADVIDAANDRDVPQLQAAVQSFVTLVEGQRDELGAAETQRLVDAARAVLDDAALAAPATPTPSPSSATPTPTPSPTQTPSPTPSPSATPSGCCSSASAPGLLHATTGSV